MAQRCTINVMLQEQQAFSKELVVWGKSLRIHENIICAQREHLHMMQGTRMPKLCVYTAASVADIAHALQLMVWTITITVAQIAMLPGRKGGSQVAQ